ncbi:hypothetical protein H4582DRAFT_2132098 [Lactarius indigo]|nr:hypothetical protein H4582DRAFT_2132098 [Lactarius indigo]
MDPEGRRGGKSKVGEAPSTESWFQFPIDGVHRYLKQRTEDDVCLTAQAVVYTSANPEYLTAEVLQLAGPSRTLLSLLQCIKDLRDKHITPQYLQLAIWGYEELDTPVRATTAGGSCHSFIRAQLPARLRSRKAHRLRNARRLVVFSLLLGIGSNYNAKHQNLAIGSGANATYNRGVRGFVAHLPSHRAIVSEPELCPCVNPLRPVRLSIG